MKIDGVGGDNDQTLIFNILSLIIISVCPLPLPHCFVSFAPHKFFFLSFFTIFSRIPMVLLPSVIIVGGVCGSGKSTVGKELALRMGHQFVDGDDFHSAENKAKMARGEPLTGHGFGTF